MVAATGQGTRAAGASRAPSAGESRRQPCGPASDPGQPPSGPQAPLQGPGRARGAQVLRDAQPREPGRLQREPAGQKAGGESRPAGPVCRPGCQRPRAAREQVPGEGRRGPAGLQHDGGASEVDEGSPAPAAAPHTCPARPWACTRGGASPRAPPPAPRPAPCKPPPRARRSPRLPSSPGGPRRAPDGPRPADPEPGLAGNPRARRLLGKKVPTGRAGRFAPARGAEPAGAVGVASGACARRRRRPSKFEAAGQVPTEPDAEWAELASRPVRPAPRVPPGSPRPLGHVWPAPALPGGCPGRRGLGVRVPGPTAPGGPRAPRSRVH